MSHSSKFLPCSVALVVCGLALTAGLAFAQDANSGRSISFAGSHFSFWVSRTVLYTPPDLEAYSRVTSLLNTIYERDERSEASPGLAVSPRQSTRRNLWFAIERL